MLVRLRDGESQNARLLFRILGHQNHRNSMTRGPMELYQGNGKTIVTKERPGCL